MNKKKLTVIRHDLVEGAPELQRQAINEHKPHLYQELLRMQEEAGQLKACHYPKLSRLAIPALRPERAVDISRWWNHR